jgi:5-methylcytosine-specific restriction endonuclease McrA
MRRGARRMSSEDTWNNFGDRDFGSQRRDRSWLMELHVPVQSDGGSIAVARAVSVDVAAVGPHRKLCRKCGEVRPLGWFVRNGSGKLRAQCRQCMRAKRAGDRYARRTRMKRQRAGRVTQADIDRIGEAQGWRCACGCGVSVRFEYHLDHIVAIARGGLHARGNLQLLAPLCNLKKGAR